MSDNPTEYEQYLRSILDKSGARDNGKKRFRNKTSFTSLLRNPWLTSHWITRLIVLLPFCFDLPSTQLQFMLMEMLKNNLKLWIVEANANLRSS